MAFRGLLTAAALVLAAALLSACATQDRSSPLRDFTQGRYGAARAWYEDALTKDGEDDVLDRNEAGLVALVQGDVEAAHRHLQEAFTGMEDLTSTTGETALAMVGPERTKRWKGDPYERCMNAYYLGVTYWIQGDADNAAACFKSGLLRDADSEKGDARSDFALLWYLLGEAQKEAGHEDRGALAFAKAHELLPKNAWLEPAKAAEANLVLALDLGLGPVKQASGPHGSIIRFRPRSYRAAYAEVVCDGTNLGRTERAVDVHHQAITRGDKVIDHVNQGKAVFKDAAVVGGALVLANSGSRTSDAVGVGLLLAGLLTPAEADVRQWDILPGEVHVLGVKLPAGEHRLRIDVKDAYGKAIPELSKEMGVTVRDGRTTFLWARAAPAESAVGSPRAGPVP
jgi:tetratricopeptide (TPR) repeat protein